jgi:RNA-splicing ligase RtcB
MNTSLAQELLAPRIFESEAAPADRELVGMLSEGVRDADLADNPVVLPDFCFKQKSEMPSSMSVATQDTIRPDLTDAALNCGMALSVLDIPKPPEDAVRRFYQRVTDRFPNPPTWKRELTRKEVLRAAVEGGDFAAERFGIGRYELDRVEEGGRLDVEQFGGYERAERELPWMVQQMGRLRFGTIGPSTHFLEMQEVEEVLDAEAAAAMGLAQGQITVQFHNGGGVLTGQLGELYGRRKAASKQLRLEMAVQKPLTHLLSSPRRARERYAKYFKHGGTVIEAASTEGDRLQLSQRLSMNYGFAYRLATFAALRGMAAVELGAQMNLIVDSPHNTIYPEIVNGRTAFVHRHNAARAIPASMLQGHPAFAKTGQPVLLPGTNRTSSYVCIAGDGSRRSLHTSPHGTGTVIKQFVQSGRSGPDPQGRRTLRFRYDGSTEVVEHYDDKGIDEALSILIDNDILRPVVRLRPFAVLS